MTQAFLSPLLLSFITTNQKGRKYTAFSLPPSLSLSPPLPAMSSVRSHTPMSHVVASRRRAHSHGSKPNTVVIKRGGSASSRQGGSNVSQTHTAPCKSPKKRKKVSPAPKTTVKTGRSVDSHLGDNIFVFEAGLAQEALSKVVSSLCDGTSTHVNLITVADAERDVDADAPGLVASLLRAFNSFTSSHDTSRCIASVYDLSGKTVEKSFGASDEVPMNASLLSPGSMNCMRPSQSCLGRMFPTGGVQVLPEEEYEEFDCLSYNGTFTAQAKTPRVEWSAEHGAGVTSNTGWGNGDSTVLRLHESRGVMSAQQLANYVLQKVSEFDVTHQIGDAAGGVVDPDILKLKDELAESAAEDDYDPHHAGRRKTIAIGAADLLAPEKEEKEKANTPLRPKPPRDDMCQLFRLEFLYTPEGKGSTDAYKKVVFQALRLFTPDTVSSVPETLLRLLSVNTPSDTLYEDDPYHGLVMCRKGVVSLDPALLFLADMHVEGTSTVIVAEKVENEEPSEICETECVLEQEPGFTPFTPSTLPCHSVGLLEMDLSQEITQESLDEAANNAIPEEEVATLDGSITLLDESGRVRRLSSVVERPTRLQAGMSPFSMCESSPHRACVFTELATLVSELQGRVSALKRAAAVQVPQVKGKRGAKAKGKKLAYDSKQFLQSVSQDTSLNVLMRLAACHPQSRHAFRTSLAEMLYAAQENAVRNGVCLLNICFVDIVRAQTPTTFGSLYRHALLHWSKHGRGSTSGPEGAAGQNELINGCFVKVGDRRINVLEELLKERRAKEELLREKRFSDEQKTALITDLRRAKDTAVGQLEHARGEVNNVSFRKEQLDACIENMSHSTKKIASDNGRLTMCAERQKREADVKITSLQEEMLELKKQCNAYRLKAEEMSLKQAKSASEVGKLERSLRDANLALKKEELARKLSHSTYDVVSRDLTDDCAGKSDTLRSLQKENKQLRSKLAAPRDPTKDPLFVELAADVRKQNAEMTTAALGHARTLSELRNTIDTSNIEMSAERDSFAKERETLLEDRQKDADEWEKERNALRLTALAQEHKLNTQEDKWRRDKASLLKSLTEGKTLVAELLTQEAQTEKIQALRALHNFLEKYKLSLLLPVLRSRGYSSIQKLKQITPDVLSSMQLDESVQRRIRQALLTVPPCDKDAGTALEAWVEKMRSRLADKSAAATIRHSLQEYDIVEERGDEESCQELSPQAFNALLWGKENDQLRKAANKISRGSEFQLLA